MYDQKTMLTMLLHVYYHLNHVNVQVGQIINHKEEDFFGQDVSNNDLIFFTMKNEFHFFHLLHVNPLEAENPLLWWATHETPFLNVSFVAHQVLGIVEYQIETERIFIIASVITSLCRSKLGNENLQHLVMITKNWPNDVRLSCLGGEESISTFMSHKENLLEENEILLEKEGFFEKCLATITFWKMLVEFIFYLYYFQSFWIV